jgi:hypothetical protein
MKDKAYIAVCKCGGIVAACMKNHLNDAAQTISSLIQEGFDIQTVASQHVRTAKWCENHGNCKEAQCSPQ